MSAAAGAPGDSGAAVACPAAGLSFLVLAGAAAFVALSFGALSFGAAAGVAAGAACSTQ